MGPASAELLWTSNFLRNGPDGSLVDLIHVSGFIVWIVFIQFLLLIYPLASVIFLE
jgi:hypothetical protein